MTIYKGTCETMLDVFGNKPRIVMIYFKKIHLGLIKIWLCYELYELIDTKTNTIVKLNNKPITGKHLSSIEFKPIWK